ncbi:MAG: GntR family transcriptional regulator [Lachnospiraceae bacterium]|nr:GntR family transcriptional regulator [Lachnospiraceae bacterium]
MKSREPKYLEIVNWIQGKIESGEFKSGNKLYSENELSEMFHISRQTVRHAIDVLEQRSLLTRIQGSGTYISGTDSCVAATEKTMNIAVVSTYVDSYIFPNIIKGIEKTLSREGYMVQIAFTNNKIERERDIIQNILEKNNIDGLIVEATKSALPNPNLMFYEQIMDRGIPVIFFNSYYPTLQAPHVALNDKLMGKKVTQYLIQKGHKKIAAIFKADDGQGHQRYAGYVEAMLEADIKLNDTNIIWLDTEYMRDLKDEKKQILTRMKGCTAVFCYNDEIAFLLEEICQKEGIAIPEDLSIIGIDNSDLASLSDIPFTSISHPMEKLGIKVSENLIHLIENPSFDATYEFDSEIVVRGSVKNLFT